MLRKNKNKDDNETAVASAETTDVALSQDVSQYKIISMELDQIKDIITNNLGQEGLKPTDLDMIKVPGAGNTIWEVPTAEGEKHKDAIEGVIIGTYYGRSYWEEAYRGGGEPPECYSPDGVEGIGNPGTECASCQFNEFGSAKTGDGKACREYKLIALVQPDEILPVIIKAPATSLKNLKSYATRLTKSMLDISSVYTKLTLEKSKFKSGHEAAVINFTKVGNVESPDRTKEYAKFLNLKKAAETALQQREENGE